MSSEVVLHVYTAIVLCLVSYLVYLLPGYKTVVFGIENECEVKIPGDPVVRVVPQLPQLRVKVLQSDLNSNELAVGKSELEASNGMKRKMSRVSIDRLELMDGES